MVSTEVQTCLPLIYGCIQNGKSSPRAEKLDTSQVGTKPLSRPWSLFKQGALLMEKNVFSTNLQWHILRFSERSGEVTLCVLIPNHCAPQWLLILPLLLIRLSAPLKSIYYIFCRQLMT